MLFESSFNVLAGQPGRGHRPIAIAHTVESIPAPHTIGTVISVNGFALSKVALNFIGFTNRIGCDLPRGRRCGPDKGVKPGVGGSRSGCVFQVFAATRCQWPC